MQIIMQTSQLSLASQLPQFLIVLMTSEVSETLIFFLLLSTLQSHLYLQRVVMASAGREDSLCAAHGHWWLHKGKSNEESNH